MATTRQHRFGSFEQFTGGYRDWLVCRGYTVSGVRTLLGQFGQIGRWLSGTGHQIADLSESRLEEFRADRRRLGYLSIPGPAALRTPLSYLREIGVVPQAVSAPTAFGNLLEEYRDWLINDRGLAAGTVLRYMRTGLRFLQRCKRQGIEPATVTGHHVNDFLLAECGRVSAGSAKGRVAELRSLLRYLFIRQITPLRLGTAVPPVGGWRLATVLPIMPARDVQTLLDYCDRGSDVGVRDFAILTIVARLGLRSMEVAGLALDDIDWRSGEIAILSKGRREDRMPLPADVGEAIAEYLRVRPMNASRNVFLTAKAPRGPIPPGLVNNVTRRACRRADLRPVGPHRIRHALAAEMLRRGADLTAIGQVLRHRDLATTALYAKVDLESLRSVALPWPEITR